MYSEELTKTAALTQAVVAVAVVEMLGPWAETPYVQIDQMQIFMVYKKQIK